VTGWSYPCDSAYLSLPSDVMPPTQSELELLADDVVYEINHFWNASVFILGQLRGDVEGNLHREAMLIHARCLMDFFLCDPKKDDVVASMYVLEWDPAADGREELAWLENNLVMYINKRVAHITAYRQRCENVGHPVIDILWKMRLVISRFLKMVDLDRWPQFAEVKRGIVGRSSSGP
jgi:hypothetical protein